ncbi:hypothetical protein RDABS01_004843 [Bienertia sinuspersici]
MAITRRSAITKEQQQSATLPPSSDAAAEINSNSNNPHEQQPQQQQQQQQQQQPQQQQQQSNAAEEISGYEQTRELRIKENRERLQKLGIFDLSHQLKSVVSTKRTPKAKFERKTPLKSPSLTSPTPSRRSSRLQNAPPVTYTEPKEEKTRRTRDIVLEEGAKPEFYTEEHEKLLGHTEMPWTFFVDGYRADGTRIYDPAEDSWTAYLLLEMQSCPRTVLWGLSYDEINNLGYKSVAHYLISTKRAAPEPEESSDATQSAKRSLPFEAIEQPNDDGSDDKEAVENIEINPHSEDNAAPAGGLDPKSEGGGRSRKRSKKELVSTSNVNDSNPSTLTVEGSDTKRAVRKSGRKSKNENVDVSEDSVKTSGTPGAEVGSSLKGVNSSDAKADSTVRRLRPRNNH